MNGNFADRSRLNPFSIRARGKTMSTKHTPGPWRAVDTRDGGGQWGAVYAGPNCICGGMREADARLIAAAPELLAALERLTSYAADIHSESDDGVLTPMRDEHPGAWRMIDAARAALAKAKGE